MLQRQPMFKQVLMEQLMSARYEHMVAVNGWHAGAHSFGTCNCTSRVYKRLHGPMSVLDMIM